VTRAVVALHGLGANLRDDAVYYVTGLDRSGERLDGAHAYVLHFPADQDPPTDAFWSLTVYDKDGYLARTSTGRVAIGDRDPLVSNEDGSLDILVQHERPAGTVNWLPTPDGPFNLTLRLYWPRASVLDGSWSPPALVRREPAASR
jgi:hypothetical protein